MLPVVLIAAVCGGIGFSMIAIEIFSHTISSFFFYSFLGFIYFSLISIGESSLRIRLLHTISNSTVPDKLAEVRREYSSEIMTEQRLRRLIMNGQLILKNDSYHLGKKRLIYVAYIFAFFKKMLMRKASC